jgi:hypothetical protein
VSVIVWTLPCASHASITSGPSTPFLMMIFPYNAVSLQARNARYITDTQRKGSTRINTQHPVATCAIQTNVCHTQDHLHRNCKRCLGSFIERKPFDFFKRDLPTTHLAIRTSQACTGNIPHDPLHTQRSCDPDTTTPESAALVTVTHSGSPLVLSPDGCRHTGSNMLGHYRH